MTQHLLFDSNVVDLADFRKRRQEKTVEPTTPERRQAAPRPVSSPSIAHQARMLAHLERTAKTGR